MSKTSDPLSAQSNEQYTYNSNGTISKVTDADGNPTSYGYDSKGNLTSVTPPSPLGKQTLTPDALSRIGTVVDGNGTTLTFQYNNLDRITSVAYNGHSPTRYTYDNDGNSLLNKNETVTNPWQYASGYYDATTGLYYCEHGRCKNCCVFHAHSYIERKMYWKYGHDYLL